MSKEIKYIYNRFNYPLLFFIFLYLIFTFIGFISNQSLTDQFINIESSIENYFVNNFLYCLLLACGGFVSFGFITIFFISMNAFVLGDTIKGPVLLNHDFMYIIINLAHGLLELPAIYFFYRIGIHLFLIIIRYFFKNDYKLDIFKELIKLLKFFIFGILLLLAAAAAEYFIITL